MPRRFALLTLGRRPARNGAQLSESPRSVIELTPDQLAGVVGGIELQEHHVAVFVPRKSPPPYIYLGRYESPLSGKS